MRNDFGIEDHNPAFTLSCPGYRGAKARTDGNLTFMIGEDVVAEIRHADLLESWTAASKLTAGEALKMSAAAASHLTDIINSGLDAGDLTEAVTDAAVVFLLAMKRQGISDPKRIPACTVMWNGQEGRERVLMGA